MINENSFLHLKNHAEKILNNISSKPNDLLKDEIQELINQVTYSTMESTSQYDNLHSNFRELQAKYNELYDSSPIGYFTLDPNWVILNANAAGEAILGVEKDSLANKSFTRYVAPDSQKIFSQYQKKVIRHKTLQKCEVKMLQRNKPLFNACLESNISAYPNTGKKEILLKLYRVSNQESDHFYQKSYNTQISRDDLNASILEWVNQPFSIIANYIHGCIHRLETGNYKIDNVISILKQTTQQLHRTAEIILHMRNFSCKGILTYEPVCIDSIIKEIIDLISLEISDSPVKIQYRSTINLPHLMLDKEYIQQAILHLTRNAIDSMIDTNTVNPKLIIEVNQLSKKSIEICIIDNGPGFNLKNTHKIFDVNYTTKPYGIGLGLSISRAVIEALGGSLTVEQNPTYGMCFKITLS